MTRFEAADAIVTALENDYACSVWSEGGRVRVYLVEVTYKSKGRVIRRDNGFISLEADGTIDFSSVDRQRGTIDGIVSELNLVIDPVAKVEAFRAPTIETPDDPMERLEALREKDLGRSGELPGA